MLKTKPHNILVNSLSPLHLSNNFDSLKEHKSVLTNPRTKITKVLKFIKKKSCGEWLASLYNV